MPTLVNKTTTTNKINLHNSLKTTTELETAVEHFNILIQEQPLNIAMASDYLN